MREIGVINTKKKAFRSLFKKKKRSSSRLGEGVLHLMLLPATLFLIVFHYIPIYGIVIAFQRYDITKGIFGGQQWIGWENFKFIFNMQDFRQAFINTFTIAVAKIIVDLLVPITCFASDVIELNELRSFVSQNWATGLNYFLPVALYYYLKSFWVYQIKQMFICLKFYDYPANYAIIP